jgi:3alpha(or 20beta)-hydroxysteroid dehydrogenase
MRRALITGCSTGIGRATAVELTKRGFEVIATARKPATLDDLDVSLKLALDVDSDESVAAAVAAAGRVDVLVNNAGVGFPPRRIEDERLEEHQRVLDTNLRGVYLGMRAVVPALSAQRSGSIVNISSIDGIVGVAGMTSYAASKFAVTGMTRTAALELGRRGIRVNSIHPGVIETPLVSSAPPETLARLQTVLDRQAISRMGRPEEVAYLALYLASDESSYCTGAQFVIDGGHLAGPYREGFDDA